MNNLQKAKQIALADLRACYKKWGVFASLVKFSDYWARDSFWASFGMLEIGDFAQARKTLELFMRYQHKSGKISRKISNDFNRIKYVLRIKIKRLKPKPIYHSPLRSNFAMDDNLLFAISFCRYVQKTGDLKFASANFLRVRSALEFYSTRNMIKGSLLKEFGLSNWMDTVFKKGFVLYTNCLWFESLKHFEWLANSLGYAQSVHLPPSKVVREDINDAFWLPGKKHFADSVSEKNVAQEYFDLAGNVLAVLFDVADPKQSQDVLRKAHSLSSPIGLHPVNDPAYPLWKINPSASLVGIYHYHNQISWSWTESLLTAAFIKQGQIKLAAKSLFDLSSLAAKNGHLHETYHLNGKVFGNFFWKPAVPFAWGSGLFLYAMSEFEKSQKQR